MNKIAEISRVLMQIKDEKLMQGFFSSLLTPAEIKAISSRWELVKMLDQGFSQREIARKMHLSLCKITRGSRELARKNSPFKKCLDIHYRIKGKGK
jgi:TrpR family trp operon transcriptional repressor